MTRAKGKAAGPGRAPAKHDVPVETGIRPVEIVAPALTPQPEIYRPFRPMLQGPGTNQLTSISGRTADTQVDKVTGLATITNGNFTLFVEKYDTLTGGMRVSTHKLLDACVIALTAQNHYRGDAPLNTLVEIPLDDYMHQCGIPMTKASKDKTRRKVKEDLEALFNMFLSWSEPYGREGMRDYAKIRIISAQGIRSGKIAVRFSEDMAMYLTHAYVMQYPLSIFRLDERNASAYYLGKKLLLHHSIENNRRRGVSGTLSVRSLLASAPDIPSYEQVMREDRHLERRIITPFQNALSALSDTVEWEYRNAKGAPLTQAQRDNFTYDQFIRCYVHFTVIENPEGPEA